MLAASLHVTGPFHGHCPEDDGVENGLLATGYRVMIGGHHQAWRGHCREKKAKTTQRDALSELRSRLFTWLCQEN